MASGLFEPAGSAVCWLATAMAVAGGTVLAFFVLVALTSAAVEMRAERADGDDLATPGAREPRA
jgi:hypothetical protein